MIHATPHSFTAFQWAHYWQRDEKSYPWLTGRLIILVLCMHTEPNKMQYSCSHHRHRQAATPQTTTPHRVVSFPMATFSSSLIACMQFALQCRLASSILCTLPTIGITNSLKCIHLQCNHSNQQLASRAIARSTGGFVNAYWMTFESRSRAICDCVHME